MKTGAEHLRGLLRALEGDAAAYLHRGLAFVNEEPELLTRVIADLDRLATASGKGVDLSPPNARGGRPHDLAATWLVEQVVDRLRHHGVKVTDENNGLCARVLQTLWPHVFAGRQAPLELKPWFKLLKT
jgi:hypothetical protein